MVSKAKRKAKRNAAKRNSGPTVEHVNRSMEKGDYKQALKEAKVGFRKSPDLYRLPLEFAFVGRAQQAARNGDRQAARGVIEDLLTLGVREPSVEAALPELLVSLGMQDRLQQFSKVPDEQLAMLALRAADESVLRPDEAPKSQPHLALDARRIREALDALYAGDESAASVCLRGIASDSPFADWRFFVRGLAAYYRQDTQSMLSNWQRLDDARFAVRIAGALKIVAGVERPDQARASARGGWDVLNRELADGSLPKQLDRLHAAVVAEDWPAAL
ncbi:MAG TPA: hypothetical protein VMX74_15055, partial [Pirellulales bacterium]|nr:hypothetical protein [Pirellulales bacterium]